MSGGVHSRDRLMEARAALEEVRERLRKPGPESIEACSASLLFAAEQLRALRAGTPETRWFEAGEMTELARELADVRNLLQQAAAFYLSWLRVLESAAGTYGADGALRAERSASVTARA